MHKFITCFAALIATTTLFAQSIAKAEQLPSKELAMRTAKVKIKEDLCPNLGQGSPLPGEKKCFPAAYNAPAGIDVKGWDIDVFGSFLYWHVSQGDMDLAHVLPTSTATTVTPGAVAYQDFKYKPGFKAGIGFNTNYDDWVGWVEYTWLHQTTSTSQTPPTLPSGAAGTWATQDWFTDAAVVVLPGSAVSSTWTMNLDILDAMFSRPFYQGTKITLDPFAGLRALWLRQELALSLGIPHVDVTTHAWAIGPNTGVMGHWMLGTSGFRFEGKAAASLLYMRYTKYSHHEQDSAALLPVTTTAGSFSAVRPIAEMGAGLGWGQYLSCNHYYLDFSVRYDFMLFWNQNVMREATAYLSGFADASDNLQMHGLTVSGRFDF